MPTKAELRDEVIKLIGTLEVEELIDVKDFILRKKNRAHDILPKKPSLLDRDEP